jgi:hypothetical protein
MFYRFFEHVGITKGDQSTVVLTISMQLDYSYKLSLIDMMLLHPQTHLFDENHFFLI